jgi:hypothetical protein
MTALAIIISTKTYAQISKATYKVMYAERYDLESEKLLAKNFVIKETYIIDFKKDQLKHIIPNRKQVYDIVEAYYADDNEEIFTIIVKSRVTDSTYHYVLFNTINKDGATEHVISRIDDETCTVFFGEVRFE